MHSNPGTLRLFWVFFPTFSTLVCVLLSLVPLGLSSTILAPPAFGLIAIFLWTLIRPDLLPAGVVFLLGLLQDLLWGGPFGLWAFVYLIAHGLTLSQRTFLIGREFGFTWVGFALVAVICSAAAWVATMLYHAQFLAPYPAIVQAVLSIAIYPLFARMTPWIMSHMAKEAS
jgi:rod shape-determining protein MreD